MLRLSRGKYRRTVPQEFGIVACLCFLASRSFTGPSGFVKLSAAYVFVPVSLYTYYEEISRPLW
jgi:hypothetical protein